MEDDAMSDTLINSKKAGASAQRNVFFASLHLVLLLPTHFLKTQTTSNSKRRVAAL